MDFRTADPEAWRAVLDICQCVVRHGGRALLVGGSVRDALRDSPIEDFDLEVYGLPATRLRSLLADRFPIQLVGESFGVLKVKRLPIDIALPRRETKTGTGHRGFDIESDPFLTFEEAASRRDFTINALGYDPMTDEILDSFGGVEDLAKRVLRHTSPRFVEDPLRVLRGMQFIARFDLVADPATLELCRTLDWRELSKERLYWEWRKLILKGRSLSAGLDFLRATGWLAGYPELEALVGCRQDEAWHPEGDVWVHTGHVMDAFARRRIGDEEEDLIVGLACLCHDLGKPSTTRFEEGRWRSPGHEEAGTEPTASFLARFTDQRSLVEAVLPLVAHHLKPFQLFKAQAGDSAVRRLARRVGRIDRLVRVATADSEGRPPLAPDLEPGAWLVARSQALDVAAATPRPLLLGRHLIARGVEPGPRLGRLLESCFEAQLEGCFEDLEGGLRFVDRLLEQSPEEGTEGGSKAAEKRAQN